MKNNSKKNRKGAENNDYDRKSNGKNRNKIKNFFGYGGDNDLDNSSEERYEEISYGDWDDFNLNNDSRRRFYRTRDRKIKHFEKRRLGDDVFNQRLEHIFVYANDNNSGK